MVATTLAQYTGIPRTQIDHWLGMTQNELCMDASYQSQVSELDINRLTSTLPYARAAYEKHLNYFNQMLKNQYGLKNSPMSEFTLGNWLLGFLQYPSALSQLAHLHRRLPQDVVREMLPDMIKILDEMPDGRGEWQAALALMTLPLIARRG